HGPPDALVGGRLRRQPPSGSGPRPGTTRPEAVRPSGAGHVQRGKRQGVAAPVRDRPVLGRDPRGSTRHGSARARLSRLAGEARGRAGSGDRGGAGAGQAARHRRRVRGAPEGHQSPARRRARGAREPAPRRHRAARPPGAAPTGATRQKSETAVFAGGCFWGVDAVFRHVRGVMAVVSGYAGGGAATAHYDIVSTSTTGHAESVEVTFDPARVSYEELLRVFFTVAHDPTERDRQGPDVGSQYRSVVFYGTPEQHTAAVAMIAELE